MVQRGILQYSYIDIFVLVLSNHAPLGVKVHTPFLIFVEHNIGVSQDLHHYKALLFKALANPLRLAILDLLREGEKTVTELQEGSRASQASVSQQLQVLRNNHIVRYRKEGNRAYYRTVDPDIYVFLDLGRKLYNRQLSRQQRVFDEL